MYTSSGARGGQREKRNPLELELEAVVSHSVRVLGMKLGLLKEQQELLTTESFL